MPKTVKKKSKSRENGVVRFPKAVFNKLIDQNFERKAIRGDGTPQSFLQASIFAREASEVGAMWHGRSWSIGRIQFSDPNSARNGFGRNWTWDKPKPKIWVPHYEFVDDRAQITFHVSSMCGQDAIGRCIDRFHKNSMDFCSKYQNLAHGDGMLVF